MVHGRVWKISHSQTLIINPATDRHIRSLLQMKTAASSFPTENTNLAINFLTTISSLAHPLQKMTRSLAFMFQPTCPSRGDPAKLNLLSAQVLPCYTAH